MFGWFKRKTPRETAPTQSQLPSDQIGNSTTSFDKPDFTIGLPFTWTETACESGFEFHNQTLPEQFIVNVQHTRTEIAADKMRAALQELVDARRNATEQLSNGKAQLAETVLDEGNGQMEARFHGRDEPNEVQLAVAIRATPTKIVTMSLYRYTLQDIGLRFAAYAATVFDLAQVKS